MKCTILLFVFTTAYSNLCDSYCDMFESFMLCKYVCHDLSLERNIIHELVRENEMLIDINMYVMNKIDNMASIKNESELTNNIGLISVNGNTMSSNSYILCNKKETEPEIMFTNETCYYTILRVIFIQFSVGIIIILSARCADRCI